MLIDSPGIYKMRNGNEVVITEYRDDFRRFNWLGFLPDGNENAWNNDGTFLIGSKCEYDIVAKHQEELEANE